MGGLDVTFHERNCHQTKNVAKLSSLEKNNDKWAILSCERVSYAKI